MLPVASDIVRELRLIERDEARRSGDDAFLKQVNGLFGDIELALRITSPDQARRLSQSLPQWTAVPYLKPVLKSRGFRPSSWIGTKGSLQHIPAETWSQLFFQSPLRGEFEVVSEHSTYGHREVSVAWGMHAAQPLYDLKAVQVTRLMHGTTNLGGEVKLPLWESTAETRFQVDGNTVTTWTNGVKIHEETFDSPPDPWLVIQAAQPTNYATINDLRILGSPEIPSEIDLIDMAGWSAWRADFYGESHSTEPDATTPWKRVGEELIGQLNPNDQADHVESLLLYQRPMLENGVIEFESWYEPGAFEVNPALGPNAYLLNPDGVRIHRLTNAQYETSPLQPGNEERFTESARGIPLKEKEWNRIRLTLTGNNLTISVNDTDVATVGVTTVANERQFGLFRYSNKTQCRVRNMVYRGDWPKTLPTLEAQDLAYSTSGPYGLRDAKTVLDDVMNQPPESLKAKGIAPLGLADRMVVGNDGLRLSLHDSAGYATFPGLIRRAMVGGDVEVTADYRDLEMSPVKEGWGLNTGLNMSLDDGQQTRVECCVSLNKDAQLVYKIQLNRTAPDGSNKTYDQVIEQNAPTAGRLRIIRVGGQVHCLVAESGSSQFRLLASFAVGNAPVSSVAFTSKSSDSVGRSAITLERLSIREAEPVENSPPATN